VTYFEFNEARTQRSTAFDVIEISDFLLTEETEIDDERQQKLRALIAAKHEEFPLWHEPQEAT
jgi:purine-nucleoside phosphorylase